MSPWTSTIGCAPYSRELDLVGLPRASAADQRLYLLQISTVFQSLATKAIDGYSGRDQCFDDFDSLRLATPVTAENEKFSRTMTNYESIVSQAETATDCDIIQESRKEDETPSSGEMAFTPG
jgi:hypothetical protein